MPKKNIYPQIALWQCSNHPNFVCLTVDHKGGGTRIFGGKCCGRWDRKLHAWKYTKEQAEELYEEMLSALEMEADDA